MRPRHRIIATALVAFSLVAGAGCGGGSTEAGGGGGGDAPKEVTLWVMNNGPEPVNDTKKLIKPFEDRSGIKVNVELVAWEIQQDRIRNAAVSGSGAPDVTQAGTTQVPNFAALGGFEDLSSRVNDIGGSGKYADGVWKTTQVIGQTGTWAVPWFTEARAVYYRKDALAAAGITDPAAAFKDWDSFKATLEKLKGVTELNGKPIKPFGLPGKKASDIVHNTFTWIWNAGGSELSSDYKTSTINSAEAAKGVQFQADLVKDGLYDASQLERSGQQVEDQFKGGSLAVWFGGPWVQATIDRQDDDAWDDAVRKQVGVIPLPAGPSGKAQTFVGGSNLMMFKTAKNKDAAWELIKYLSQDDIQTQYAALMGMFPARLAPQEAAGNKSDTAKGFYTAIKNGRSYAAIPQWGEIETVYKDRFGAIMDAAGQGSYTPETITKELGEAKKEADAILAQSPS
jgi:multiple sugar transport system substrate-binding protein